MRNACEAVRGATRSSRFADLSGALFASQKRVVASNVSLICGAGRYPLCTRIRKVEVSSHRPSYSMPSGSDTLNTESTYSRGCTPPIKSVEMFVGRSKKRVSVSPLPNSRSPASGSSPTTAASNGATRGSFPMSE